MALLNLSITPRIGRRPTLDQRRAQGQRLFADVAVNDQGVTRVLNITHLDTLSEGTASFIKNCEQGHWARDHSLPLLAEALGHKDWPACWAALRQAVADSGRKVRSGRIRCEIVGVEA
ncbi:MAG TPA: hypothetical protein VEA44_16080 [Caulobacter sp.]|nr:hypothetical protein [Caulobacter sp.]